MRPARFMAAALMMAAATAQARGQVEIIPTASKISALIATSAGPFAGDGKRYFKIERCGTRICLEAGRPRFRRPKAPAGALPDGKIAELQSGDIRRAWYAAPTRRYGHGILGDRIEAGSLIAEGVSGRQYRFDLPETHVFEDLAPRIADLDGDGTNEVVAIRSSLTKGSAVAVYGLLGGKLVLKARSNEIGRARRWLNIAGIDRYFGSRRPLVAWVETPHIGGTLRFASYRAGKLVDSRPPRPGFSNHFIGSRELGMSAARDFDGDGTTDLALPSADRRSLRIVTKYRTTSMALPGQVATALLPFGDGLLAATSHGVLIYIRPQLRR
jgi:hypothetical protein